MRMRQPAEAYPDGWRILMQEYDIALKPLLQGSATLTMRERPARRSRSGWMWSCQRCKTSGWTFSARLSTAVWSTWNCKAATTRQCRYEWRNTACASSVCSDDSRARSSCTWENCNSGWRASCVVPTCCSGTARSIFARWMETACWKVQILARLRDHRGAIRKIMERIAGLAAAERETALAQLLILAGLRRLAKTVEQEARKMPIHINILENEVLGRCSRGAWTKGVRKAN